MRNYIIVFMLFFSVSAYPQAITSSAINNKETAGLLGSIESYELFSGKQLAIGIFKVANGSGSANLPESHEISYNLLLTIAEFDEDPDRKLFSIGSFIGPKVIRKLDSGQSVTLFVEHGVFDRRKTTKVVAGLTSIQIQN
jgi:hypothetical protein